MVYWSQGKTKPELLPYAPSIYLENGEAKNEHHDKNAEKDPWP